MNAKHTESTEEHCLHEEDWGKMRILIGLTIFLLTTIVGLYSWAFTFAPKAYVDKEVVRVEGRQERIENKLDTIMDSLRRMEGREQARGRDK